MRILFSILLIFACVSSSRAGERSLLIVSIENATSYLMQYHIPVGAMYDSVPGIAHVLEHAKFQHMNGKALAPLKDIDGSYNNAVTTSRYTRYDVQTLPAGVSAAADFFATLQDPLVQTEQRLKAELKVVQQEILERTRSDLDTEFYINFGAAVYKGTVRERWPGGTPEGVIEITQKQVLDFDAAHYRDADPFILVVGPPLDASVEKALLERLKPARTGRIHVAEDRSVTFDDAQLKGMPRLWREPPPYQLSSELVDLRRESETQRETVFSSTRLIESDTSHQPLMASFILNDAMNSRLKEGFKLRVGNDPLLITSFRLQLEPVQKGLWSLPVNAALWVGVTPEMARKALDDYLQEIATNGISEKSFERLKKRYFLTKQWDDPIAKARSLGDDIVAHGYDFAVNWRENLAAVTHDDVQNLARILARADRTGEAILTPKKDTP